MTEQGYAAGEALIMALVARVSGFTVGNVVRGKWGVLNTGKAAKYAILKPGAANGRRFETPNEVTEPWTTTVQVWHRYKDDGQTLIDLEADVESITEYIDQYPHLGDTLNYVMDSNVTAYGEVQEMWTKGGGPAWLRQDITIEWLGQRIITFA